MIFGGSSLEKYIIAIDGGGKYLSINSSDKNSVVSYLIKKLYDSAKGWVEEKHPNDEIFKSMLKELKSN